MLPDTNKADNADRIILLLDLDCFYAQAMCIRLGFDSRTTPLALFQWNSVLAVTYPARERYKVKRGDSWDVVKRKSDGQCLGVHVPILEHSEGCTVDTTVTTAASLSLQEEYDAFYVLSDTDKDVARKAELGVRKLSSQGKASIECFRIASARIFQTVQAFLEEQFPGVILERASIDEFFLDVTAAASVVREQNGEDTTEAIAVALAKTSDVVSTSSDNLRNSEDETMRRLQVGCWIAHGIRMAVLDSLGYTLSAGIAHNKTIAKLAASYGKPNGQAVCYPDDVPDLLDDTPISKCRFLGGKLGEAVTKLLPQGVATKVGSIAKNLSLVELQQGMKDTASARWVYDIAHGIDTDVVEAKEETSLLPKSITAFKSMNFCPPGSNLMGHSLTEASKWIQLLVKEILQRVERDTSRNHRYPTMCTLQYATERTQSNKSMRVPFPSTHWPTERRVTHLIEIVTKTLDVRLKHSAKNSTLRLHRVGICATDFVAKDESTQSIATLFAAATATPSGNIDATASSTQPAAARIPPSPPRRPIEEPHDACANDLAMAQKLQDNFDREQRMVEVLEQRNKQKKRKEGPRRIDSFFRKK